jgi:hypothetical protein
LRNRAITRPLGSSWTFELPKAAATHETCDRLVTPSSPGGDRATLGSGPLRRHAQPRQSASTHSLAQPHPGTDPRAQREQSRKGSARARGWAGEPHGESGVSSGLTRHGGSLAAASRPSCCALDSAGKPRRSDRQHETMSVGVKRARCASAASKPKAPPADFRPQLIPGDDRNDADRDAARNTSHPAKRVLGKALFFRPFMRRT